MRSILKTATLESKFPILSVEKGCILSKEADVTVAFRITLPELFTVTSAEYEAMHSCWVKALKILPPHTVVHKQDWFIGERYRAESDDMPESFLSRSFERHFFERPYLHHDCYLFVTKTTRERMRTRSDFSTLCRGFLVPKEVPRPGSRNPLSRRRQSGRRYSERERPVPSGASHDRRDRRNSAVYGLLGRYLALSRSPRAVLEDMRLDPGEMRVGDKRLCLHTLSDLDDLPQSVETDAVTSGFPPTGRTVGSRSPHL